MNEQTENLSAFPDPCGAHPGAHPPHCDKGMTLRDYFAAKAINLFSLDRTEIAQLQSGEWEPLHNLAAKFCYQLADAMLRARKEQP